MKCLAALYAQPHLKNHKIFFKSKQDAFTYYNTVRLPLTHIECAYDKVKRELRLSNPLPNTDSVFNVSYVRLNFNNLEDSRYQYFYVSDVTVLNESVVAYKLEPDYFTTYAGEWQFQPCYVERLHMKRWDSGTPLRLPNIPINSGFYEPENIHALTSDSDNSYQVLVYWVQREVSGKQVNVLQLAFAPYSQNPVGLLARGGWFYAECENSENIAGVFSVPILGAYLSGDRLIFTNPNTGETVSSTKQTSPDGVNYYVMSMLTMSSCRAYKRIPFKFIEDDYYPKQPTEGVNYSPIYEPSLWQSPVRRYFISSNLSCSEVNSSIAMFTVNAIIDTAVSATSVCSYLTFDTTYEPSVNFIIGNGYGNRYPFYAVNCDYSGDAFQNYLAMGGRLSSALGIISSTINSMGFMSIGGNPLAVGVGTATTAVSGLIDTTRNEFDLQNKSAIQHISGQGVFATNLSNNSNVFAIINRLDGDTYLRVAEDVRYFGHYPKCYMLPEFTRKRFNYIKVSSPAISGEIPLYACESMNNDLYGGVTFWNKNVPYMDYSLENVEGDF